MFYEDKSTEKIGVCYGGEERPLEGELSERKKQERERDAQEERDRLIEGLPESWRRFVQ